jgi:hypothetical protein
VNLNIIGITVCYKHLDVLKDTISNAEIFHKWFIITSKEDQETIDFINNINQSNKFELIFFPFEESINRGKAINLALKEVYSKYHDFWILSIDADIYIPDELKKSFIDGIVLNKNNIYYTSRVLVDSFEDYLKNKDNLSIFQKLRPRPIGYFQFFFKKNIYFSERYESWGTSDFIFPKDNFGKNTVKIFSPVIHIGKIQKWVKKRTYTGLEKV